MMRRSHMANCGVSKVANKGFNFTNIVNKGQV